MLQESSVWEVDSCPASALNGNMPIRTSLATLQGILLELPLASFFLKKLLHMGCDLHDLPSLDAELYKSLLFLRDYDGDTEDLALSFTVTNGALGQNKEVHLRAYLHITFPGSQADCALRGNSISIHTVLLSN